ncbi:hypothetical protein MXZ36_09840 [Streptococcus uberis]|nr:hypothetical protein [Streptococcus uberis]
MVLKLLAILPSGSAGKFLKKNLEFGKMGGYYDPPISAECQHGQQIPLSLRATRDTAINKKVNKPPTNFSKNIYKKQL